MSDNETTPARMPLSSHRLISRKALALQLGCSPHTLAVWHVQGRGIPCVKIGSRAMYRVEDVDRFIEERTRNSTAEELPPMAAG